MLEDACEALGAVDAEGVRVGARGHLADLRLLRQQAADHGRGRDDRRRRRPRSRPACAASATRAARRTWAGSTHDRLGFNYRLTELQAALGVAQLERLDELLAERARVAALYARAPGGARCGAPAGEGDPAGLVLPCADRGRRAAQLVRLRGPAAGRRPTAMR